MSWPVWLLLLRCGFFRYKSRHSEESSAEKRGVVGKKGGRDGREEGMKCTNLYTHISITIIKI